MPITVDASQVHSITVDPSQVQAVPAGPLPTPQPVYQQPEGSAFSRVLGALNPFPTLKHYLFDLDQQEQSQIGQQLHAGDYVGAVKTAIRQLPGVDFSTDMAKAQAHQAAEAYRSATNPTPQAPSDRIAVTAGHALAAVVPFSGPMAADAGEKLGTGDVAGGVAEGAAALIPEARKLIPRGAGVPLKVPSSLDPTETAAVQFADQHGVPLDTATRTGSTVARYSQSVLQHSLPSAGIAKSAAQASEAALKTTGADLAGSISPADTSPEAAGQGVRDALAAEAKQHDAAADAAYSKLRTIEADPKNARLVETREGAQNISSKTPAPSAETPQVAAASSSAGGSQTTIPIPGEQETNYPAHYELRELGDLKASHDGMTFQENPDYPFTNDRDYTKPEAKARVVKQAQGLDTSRLLSDAPEATSGPPVVDPAGNVLGGNSRTMMMQRVYGSADDSAAQLYRARLAAKAESFGVDADQLKAMKQPVLVRVLDGEHDPQTAITDFNKNGTASLNPAEQAVADARRLSPETMDYLGGAVEKRGEGATLADTLSGPEGPAVVQRLVDDGVLTEGEKPKYLAKGVVTSEAKQRIGRMLAARSFDNAADFENTPVEIRNKLERLAAPLARLAGHTPDWDITPKVQAAAKMLAEAKQRGVTLDDLTAQKGMFDAGHDPETVQLAKALETQKGSALAAAMREYADAAAPSHPDAPLAMFGTPDRGEAFDQLVKGSPATSAAPEATPAAGPAPTAAQQAAPAASKPADAPAPPTVRSVALPVDTRAAKSILLDTYQKMTRLMPIAQQRASVGLVAIQNILDGADVMPASEADQNLSALKAAQREANTPQAARLLNMAVDQLSKSIDAAVKQAGPEAVEALRQGRESTTAKYAALDTLAKLREEPVQAFGQLFAQKDANVNLLRDVAAKAPDAVKAAGRAYVEQLIGKAFSEGGTAKPGSALADWLKVGPQTRELALGGAVAKNFDSFFLLAKKLAENPNPSGSGYVVSFLTDAGLLVHPAVGAPVLLGKNLLARLMFSPAGARLLAEGVRIPLRATAAATLTSSRILEAAGVNQRELAARPASLQLPAGMPQAVSVR